MKKSSVGIIDRIVSVISYLTAGWGGLIYCIIMYFAKRKITKFAYYNIFQSIFISLLYFVLSLACGLLFKFLAIIPFVNYVSSFIMYMFIRPVLFDYSIIQLFMTSLIVYMMIISAQGKIPRIIWISKIVDRQIRR